MSESYSRNIAFELGAQSDGRSESTSSTSPSARSLSICIGPKYTDDRGPDCCARTASGQTAVPPIAAMNSRRLMPTPKLRTPIRDIQRAASLDHVDPAGGLGSWFPIMCNRNHSQHHLRHDRLYTAGPARLWLERGSFAERLVGRSLFENEIFGRCTRCSKKLRSVASSGFSAAVSSRQPGRPLPCAAVHQGQT